MAAPYEALPVLQRTQGWLDARDDGVGASEAAAALGLSRWESRYSKWGQKLHLVPPPEPTLAMEIGTATEELNAARFEAETGFRTRKVRRLLRSKARPHLLASLDRDVVGEDAVLEEKWTERGEGYGEPGTDEVPDEVLCQVVQQMAVTGRSRAYVSVLFGGRRHGIYVVDRDQVAEEALLEGIDEFWGYVQRRIQPPVDGSDATLRALAAAYPRDSGEELEADEQARRLLAELRLQTDVRDTADGAIAELKAQLQSVMGPASALIAPGIGRVTWKAAKDSEVTDWKALAQVYGRTVDTLASELRQHVPSLALEGVDVSTDEGLALVHESLRAIYTTTKPGSRRFLPRWEEETNG